MSAPRVLAVVESSPAHTAGVVVDDEIISIDSQIPRDIIEWRWLTDEADPELQILRGGLELTVQIEKPAGVPLGIEVHSSLFDQVRTCDNHCEFCFIYQLPPGLRKSLYLKDDDYRLSFLYGNFTTLTRFTEVDLERVITERISPLNVSIHATDPVKRSEMLRNRRGGTSLRWLRALLDHGIEVHGQIVCCPGLNDGEILGQTLAGVLDEFPELASVCVVPLGISRHNTEQRMLETTKDQARQTIEIVHTAQATFLKLFGRRVVFAADEYYLIAEQTFPEADSYEGFSMYEDGIGMARAFEAELLGLDVNTKSADGFFAWSDAEESARNTRYEAAADLDAPLEGYRAVRVAETSKESSNVMVKLRPRSSAPVAILTSRYGAKVLEPLLELLGRSDVRTVTVDNRYFGGNVAVTGLMVGEDLNRVLAGQPDSHRYLLPDVCLSGGRFLDGTSLSDLVKPVEVIATNGQALKEAVLAR